MAGRAAKQSYLGRVIHPAKFHPGNNGNKPFLTFTVYVERLAVNKNKERVSGRIYCSYVVAGENDPVGHILCKVHNKENPTAGGLAGQQYKSVEVWVEGSEKLVEALDSNGQEVQGAYVKYLEYCTVQVTDKDVMRLYGAQFKSGETEEDSVATPQVAPNPFNGQVEQPNVAPSSQPRKTAKQQATKAPASQATPLASTQPARSVWRPGDRLVKDGLEYELVGEDFNKASNWKLLGPAGVPTPPSNTFNGFGSNTSIKSMLEEEDVTEDSPFFGDSEKLPV